MSREQEYIEMYKEMHKVPTAFPGKTKVRHKDLIKELVCKYGVVDILDYGSGKGQRWEEMGLPNNDIICFDPAVEEFNELPNCQQDMVVCTDVMEHIPEEGVGIAFNDIGHHALKCAFITIAMEPALAILPNGENAHCTLKPEEWWLKWAKEYMEVPTTIVFSYHQSGVENVVTIQR